MNKLTYILALFGLTLLLGCLKTESTSGERVSIGADSAAINPQASKRQIVSALGVVLPEKQLSRSERISRERKLEAARNNYQANPDSVENIIWYGRRLAYLGRYIDAIDVYTRGLQKYPESYRLLRHRGHRYITIRKFDDAIRDLTRAAYYSRDFENAIEPDGLPNRLNKPLSNDQFNIWYHLGLSYYLKGNFDKAISSFKKCMDVSDNDDLKVATTNWFYLTYQKIGNVDYASGLIRDISPNLQLIENQSYHDLIMLHRGLTKAETLLRKANALNNALDPTLGYGIGNWYLSNGNVDQAREIFSRVLLHPSWDAFGYVASEVELSNLAGI